MDRVYEKYAWVVFLALGVLWVVVGFVQAFFPEGLAEVDAHLITGMSWNRLKALSPEATDLVRFLYGGFGILKMSWSFFVLAVTLTGYRKGEKWAWYTLWLVPIILVSSAIFNASYTGDVYQTLEWIPIMTVTLLGLLLPFRKFFPR
jgi:hypothetical protein